MKNYFVLIVLLAVADMCSQSTLGSLLGERFNVPYPNHKKPERFDFKRDKLYEGQSDSYRVYDGKKRTDHFLIRIRSTEDADVFVVFHKDRSAGPGTLSMPLTNFCLIGDKRRRCTVRLQFDAYFGGIRAGKESDTLFGSFAEIEGSKEIILLDAQHNPVVGIWQTEGAEGYFPTRYVKKAGTWSKYGIFIKQGEFKNLYDVTLGEVYKKLPNDESYPFDTYRRTEFEMPDLVNGRK